MARLQKNITGYFKRQKNTVGRDKATEPDGYAEILELSHKEHKITMINILRAVTNKTECTRTDG